MRQFCNLVYWRIVSTIFGEKDRAAFEAELAAGPDGAAGDQSAFLAAVMSAPDKEEG